MTSAKKRKLHRQYTEFWRIKRLIHPTKGKPDARATLLARLNAKSPYCKLRRAIGPLLWKLVRVNPDVP